jgi:glycosyl transferase family 8
MIELRDWITTTSFERKPWLLLGKGPTFTRRGEFPLGDYNLMGLNNVVTEQRVDVAHIIDVDVVEKCADALRESCGQLLMARRPHVRFRAGERLLEDYFDELPVLRELDEQGRLVWYNADTSPPVGNSPSIGVSFFSSEAAMNILGEMGAEKVRTLGIDGGTDYGQEFKELPELQNGLPSFDAQFRQIEDIVARRGIDYDPLIEPMRVFCGLDETQLVAARTLEYTIRKHASRPVRFYPMLDVPTPVPKDPSNRGRTGFSFARFHIPKLSGYRGRALYVDADMQVFSDLAELWEIPFDGAKVMCTRQDEPPPQWKDVSWFHPGRQLSVMMLDCERLDWDVEEIVGGLDEGRYRYEQLMFELCIVDPEEMTDDLPPQWNHLEHYEPGQTSLIHYTVVPTQPWKTDKNGNRELWERDFAEALAAEVVHEDEVERLAKLGYIKRSLAGLPPVGRVTSVLNSVAARLKWALQRVAQRYKVFQHPSVMRVRRRLGF